MVSDLKWFSSSSTSQWELNLHEAKYGGGNQVFSSGLATAILNTGNYFIGIPYFAMGNLFHYLDTSYSIAGIGDYYMS